MLLDAQAGTLLLPDVSALRCGCLWLREAAHVDRQRLVTPEHTCMQAKIAPVHWTQALHKCVPLKTSRVVQWLSTAHGHVRLAL